MKKIFVLIILLCSFLSLSATNTFESWYDNSLGYDESVDITPNADFTRFYLVGVTCDSYYADYYINLISVDQYGGQIWNERIRGDFSTFAEGEAICQGNVGLVAVGNTYESTTEYYPYIINFDNLDFFSILDSSTVNNYDSTQYMLEASDIMCSPDGMGYILTGTADLFAADTLKKVFIMKLDNSFNVLWEYYYTFYSYKITESEAITNNDTLFGVTGYVLDTLIGFKDVFILITDSSGNIVNVDIYQMSIGDDAGLDITGNDLPDYFGISGYAGDSLFVLGHNLYDSIWTRKFQFENFILNKGECILELLDNSYIVGGYSIDTITWQLGGLISLKLNSGNGSTIWSQYYSHPGQKGADGICYDDSDSGIVFSGLINGNNAWGTGTNDAYIIKLDFGGNFHPEWWNFYGDIGWDEFRSFDLAAQGGYVLAGGTDDDMYLVYTDPRGYLVWEESFGETGITEKAYSVIWDSIANNYIISGTREYNSEADGLIYHVDQNGNATDTLIIQQGNYYLYDMKEVEVSIKGRGYIFTGASKTTTEKGGSDILAVMIDSNLNLLWDLVYVSTEDRVAYSVSPDAVLERGGYIFTGASKSTTEDTIFNVYLMKTNDMGVFQWDSTYFQGEGYSVFSLAPGAFLVTGYHEHSTVDDSEIDVFLMLVDGSNGHVAWETTPSIQGEQKAYDITEFEDTIIVSGYSLGSLYSPNSEKNIMLMKFDMIGNYLGMIEYYQDGNQESFYITSTDDNCYAFCGYTDWDCQTPFDALFAKNYANYACAVYVEEEEENITGNNGILVDFHNPSLSVFSDRTELSFSIYSTGHVEFKIFDSTGRLVKTFTNIILQPGYYSYVWDGRNDENIKISSGVYFCRLSVGNRSLTKKISFIE